MTCSKEHVLQFALGGSNEFSTNDASRKYNNELGDTIDAQFVNLLPLAIKRHMLKIPGQSGIIPPIIWRAKSLNNNEPATITISADGDIDYKFDTVVIDDQKKNYKERLVAGSPDRVHEILRGMLEKARKKDETIYTKTGEKIARSEDFESHFEVEETDIFRASVQAFDFDVWVRGIFKIILGLGHVILGPEWTFSADGGDRIRTVIFCDKKNWPHSSMKGFSTGRIPDGIRKTLGMTPASSKANIHTIAILPMDKEPVAVVSLFGGDNVPEAMVTLGSERGRLAIVNDNMIANTRVGVRINPANRQTTWITVSELDRNT